MEKSDENFQPPIKVGTDHILKFMQDFMKIPVQPTSESGKTGGFDSPFEGADTFVPETNQDNTLAEEIPLASEEPEDEDIFDLQDTEDNDSTEDTFFEDSKDQKTTDPQMSTTFPWLDDEDIPQQNQETENSFPLDTSNDLTGDLDTVLDHLDAISQHFQGLSSSLRHLINTLKKRT